MVVHLVPPILQTVNAGIILVRMEQIQEVKEYLADMKNFVDVENQGAAAREMLENDDLDASKVGDESSAISAFSDSKTGERETHERSSSAACSPGRSLSTLDALKAAVLSREDLQQQIQLGKQVSLSTLSGISKHGAPPLSPMDRNYRVIMKDIARCP
jgi:hypothetical protein